ncbi:MAG: sterol desaturase family protein [Ignavibacteria bacterium]|nr:sterol desaturase family protein [Ignavibacteria bacterium]MBK9403766.1 sterol desaturase family protein [Ignavibacteria bacterium]
MSLQFLSLIIISAAAVLMIVLEKYYPYTKGQKIFREGFFNDIVMYSVFQSYVLGLIIFGFLNWIKFNTDLYQYSLIGSWPVWVQVLFFLVTHDFYIYWFHRWQHHNKILWRTHEAHHSPKTIDWLSGARSHSLEILINQTVEFAPIILLGAAPEVAIYKGMISAIWGMFIHSNIDVRLGKLQYFINGPEMHRWHHSDDGGKEYQNNFSTKLAVWDWLFGTAFFPDPAIRKPKRFGLSDTPDYPLSEKEFPHKNFWKVFIADIKAYIRQHIYAFRKF